MKLSRKNLGRVATTFLATAMLASLTAVPAFAAENQFEGQTNDEGDYTVKMTKNLTLGTDLYQPTETFEFNIQSYKHGEQEAHETLNNIPVSDGVDKGVSVKDAVFTSSTTKQTTADIEITVDLQAFSTSGAGVYKYTLTENPGTNPNVTYDNDTKYLYVIIENDTENQYNNSLQVGGVVVKDKAATGNIGADDKSSTFDNKYDEKDDNTDTLHNLTLTKKIEGSAANLNDEFSFTIQITNDDADDHQILTIKNGEDVKTIEVNGSSVSYELGKDETVEIIGLREGDEYTITEAENVTHGVTSDGYTVYINDDDRSEAADEDGRINGTIDDTVEDVNVSFLNYRESVSPTGIAMDIAPYALLVVIAAAGCFVFLRKRNED